MNMLLTGGIFIAIYGIIISEKMNRASVAVFGAAIMVLFGLVSEENVVGFIDFGTIGLLIGMMIIVNIMKKTGVFEYVAIRSAKLVKADPWRMMVIFAVITACSSAFLDNVTTILLVAPITFVITEILKIDAYPFIVIEVFMANVGGTATLIGDPPNIMIGSENGLSFMDFLVHLGPIVVIIFFSILAILKIRIGHKIKVSQSDRDKVMKLDHSGVIRDHVLLRKSLAVLVLTIVGFMIHNRLGLESATVALSGAAILMFISGIDMEDVFMDIEWTTIFFFIALFILVGGLEEAGIIQLVAHKIMAVTNGNQFLTLMAILWGSALLSAFLDNIPFVATMIPIIKSMGAIGGIDVTNFWWALALGACLGGNGTMIGASANVIACGMLEKKGHKVRFLEYMNYAFPLMIVSIVMATIYLVVFS